MVIFPAKLPEVVSPLNVPLTVELVLMLWFVKKTFTVPVPGPIVPLQVPEQGDADCAEAWAGSVATKTTATKRRNVMLICRIRITTIKIPLHSKYVKSELAFA